MSRPRRPGITLASASQALLIVFARAPSAPGKTRLTSKLAPEQARALREALFLDTLDISRSVGVPLCVRYTPTDARDEMAALAGDVMLAPQSEGDLGARMLDTVASSLDSGATAVVMIGSDLPTLPRAHVIDAFAQLDAGADCVFGPADDGGYYAVGVTGRGRNVEERAALLDALFTGITWGTAAVLQQSLAAASATRVRAEMIAPWYDVDHADDLRRVLEDRNAQAPRTRAWCASHFPTEPR